MSFFMTTQSHGFCLYKTDFRCFLERKEGGGRGAQDQQPNSEKNTNLSENCTQKFFDNYFLVILCNFCITYIQLNTEPFDVWAAIILFCLVWVDSKGEGGADWYTTDKKRILFYTSVFQLSNTGV